MPSLAGHLIGWACLSLLLFMKGRKALTRREDKQGDREADIQSGKGRG